MHSLLDDFKKAPPQKKSLTVGLGFVAVLVLVLTAKAIVGILGLQLEESFHKEIDSAGFINIEEELDRDSASYTYVFELKNIGVQLMSRETVNMGYLQFTLLLDCPSASARERIERERAKILDAIFDVSNNHALEDLQGGAGLNRFKRTVHTELIRLFGEDAPRRIDVRDWVVS